MSMKEMMYIVFPPASTEMWKQKAEETLKGKPVDTLAKTTYEDIRLKPLYTREDLENQKISQFPGDVDYRRGTASLGYLTNDWNVAQNIPLANSTEMKAMLESSLQKGQTAISFELSEGLLAEIPTILENVYSSYPFSINAKGLHSQLLEIVGELAQQNDTKQDVTGYIGIDPIALMVEGASSKDAKEAYDVLAETIQKADESLPNVKTILIDTTPYHNGGANAVQELAIALATGVELLQALTERSLSVEKILDKIVFKFAIGSNFFMEMAKLRAAKLLWSKLTEAYDVDPGLRKMVIAAETSKFTKTKYDPYVNLLRAGNEAFAAILGGIQYLHVSPYNEPEGKVSAFSDRIARNTQLVLKEEAHLTKVVDPAGGSYYIESITNELAEKAWELFLEIEENNGLLATIKSNWLQDQISTVKEKRNKDVFTRKQSIIGTNIYANLQDEPLNVENSEDKSATNEGAIPQERLSQPYENLRAHAEQLKEQTSVDPSIGLISLGALKQHKARADFITGFVAPGGIKTVKSEEIHSISEAIDFTEKTQVSHYCICGTNDQYNEIGPDFVAKIKAENPSITLFLAGAPENQSEWLEAGIAEVITVKSNCYQTLAKLLDELEVESK